MASTAPGRVDPAEHLRRCLPAGATLAVAVSGGVDSMTLAHFVARRTGAVLVAFHAVSPAVPPRATARVRAHAAEWGWDLRVIDAGEFADPAYRANPVHRCFHCKTSLYRTVRAAWAGELCSGTNRDDLGDFRPGLRAAADWTVRQPLADAGIGKAGVRELARQLGLADLQDLPAQPCLASRVETGIPIEPADLRMVDRIELLVRDHLGDVRARCRLRARGVALELDGALLARLPAGALAGLEAGITALCADWQRPFAGIEAYRQGSAFLRGDHAT